MPIPVTYKLYDGPITLAGEFPPTLNKDNDATTLEVFESPDCYGVDWDTNGILTPGSVPTGVARVAPVGTGSYTGWNWYYNRLMKVNGTTATQLDVGAPEYSAYYYAQDVGSRTCWADIITFMPALQEALLIVTATGSHLMQNMLDPRGFFYLSDFEQMFFASDASYVNTLQGVPYVCNSKGLFSWDGKKVTEITRPIRNNISPFSNTALLADYDERLIIGTSKFVYDSETQRLFDYSTSGFRFTSRTVTQPTRNGRQPFQVKGIVFLLDITASGNQTIEWESRVDNNSWFTEPNVLITQKEKRIERNFDNPVTTAREFTMRITSATAGVRIREIQLIVETYNQETILGAE